MSLDKNVNMPYMIDAQVQEDPNLIFRLSSEQLKDLKNFVIQEAKKNLSDDYQLRLKLLLTYFLEKIDDEEVLKKVLLSIYSTKNRVPLYSHGIASNDYFGLPLAQSIGEEAVIYWNISSSLLQYASGVPYVALPGEIILAIAARMKDGRTPDLPEPEYSSAHYGLMMVQYLYDSPYASEVENDLIRFGIGMAAYNSTKLLVGDNPVLIERLEKLNLKNRVHLAIKWLQNVLDTPESNTWRQGYIKQTLSYMNSTEVISQVRFQLEAEGKLDLLNLLSKILE